MNSKTELSKMELRFIAAVLSVFVVCSCGSAFAQTELVVAADGSAKYKTVQEAIMAVPAGTADSPVVILIKPGLYKELIYVQREKRFFKLIGENAEKPDNQPFGFVFSYCKITGESPAVRAYLGRPWRAFSSVVYLNTEMSEVVRPVGWHNWNFPEREKTARYAEFKSRGPGAKPQERVNWSRQLTRAEAKAVTAQKVLGGS
jgi:pectin methylesterase-like acyl-CoA thioesterase